MNITFITEYYIPVVVAGCLIIGYVIKNYLNRIPNKFIPLILAVIGAALGCLAGKHITLESIVYGAISGLASTGLHQTYSKCKECVHSSETEIKDISENPEKENLKQEGETHHDSI
ncbi:MAG: phage holin family protein [Hespellia sp.]|nr:phage holin family protein [Hespellia sp.]